MVFPNPGESFLAEVTEIFNKTGMDEVIDDRHHISIYPKSQLKKLVDVI